MVGDRARVGVLLAAGLVALGACQGSSGSVAPTTIASSTSTVVVATTSTVPPTTVYRPTAPQPSQDLAGSHLVTAWQAGDRTSALTDATAAAVDAVFAQPYPAGGLQARGCSTPVAGPATCTYRILANGNLLTLTAEAGPGGWLVSAARFQT